MDTGQEAGTQGGLPFLIYSSHLTGRELFRVQCLVWKEKHDQKVFDSEQWEAEAHKRAHIFGPPHR